jgi:hypothetical protein
MHICIHDKWCLRWESNPQNSASKTDMYANSITEAKKVVLGERFELSAATPSK